MVSFFLISQLISFLSGLWHQPPLNLDRSYIKHPHALISNGFKEVSSHIQTYLMIHLRYFFFKLQYWDVHEISQSACPQSGSTHSSWMRQNTEHSTNTPANSSSRSSPLIKEIEAPRDWFPGLLSQSQHCAAASTLFKHPPSFTLQFQHSTAERCSDIFSLISTHPSPHPSLQLYVKLIFRACVLRLSTGGI